MSGPTVVLVLSLTETGNETVWTKVGVPPIVSVLPPVLLTFKPFDRATGEPLVGTTVPFTLKVKGPTPPEAAEAAKPKAKPKPKKRK